MIRYHYYPLRLCDELFLFLGYMIFLNVKPDPLIIRSGCSENFITFQMFFSSSLVNVCAYVVYHVIFTHITYITCITYIYVYHLYSKFMYVLQGNQNI